MSNEALDNDTANAALLLDQEITRRIRRCINELAWHHDSFPDAVKDCVDSATVLRNVVASAEFRTAMHSIAYEVCTAIVDDFRSQIMQRFNLPVVTYGYNTLNSAGTYVMPVLGNASYQYATSVSQLPRIQW